MGKEDNGKNLEARSLTIFRFLNFTQNLYNYKTESKNNKKTQKVIPEKSESETQQINLFIKLVT